MARNKGKLDLPDLNLAEAPPKEEVKKTKKTAKSSTPRRKIPIGKIFREMISELKKVEWASFKKTKNNDGVFSQTGTVLVVVLFFLIIISLFDAGLGQLLKLLLESASAS